MTNSVSHGTFTLEREYPLPAERVFAAWTTADAKRGWYAQEEGFIAETDEYELDFQVGGVERLVARLTNGKRISIETTFCDIVPNERIVATYDILLDERRISVSLYSVQLSATNTGTRLVTTEHGAFLDGLDTNEQRQLGAASDLEQLARYLDHSRPTDRFVAA